MKRRNVQGIFGETFILALPSSVVFRLQIVSQISFNLFCSGDKRFYQSSLGNEVDFRDIINVSPSILARHGFADKRALLTTTLTSSCHSKTLVPFCTRKNRPEKAFLTLTMIYHKIVQKDKIFHSKQ